MTTRSHHLTDAEFVDLLDGSLDGGRRRHVDECEACAAQAADLAGVVSAASEVDVPEPPPFFWSQLSARVSDTVAREGGTSSAAAVPGWLPSAWLGGALAAAAMVIWMVLPRSGTDAPVVTTPPAVERSAAAHPDAGVGDELPDLEEDEAWALVRSLAADLDQEQMDAEGVSPGAGAAERLALQLTDAERTELARLLEEQLRRSGAPESAS